MMLACILRTMTKKSTFEEKRELHPMENPGYVYGNL